MRQYSETEIQSLIEAKGGDENEQAAAIAVVTQSIIESRRLGRIATGTPKSSWVRSNGQMREQQIKDWKIKSHGL